MDNKIYTWDDLLSDIQKLSPEQRQMPVLHNIEDEEVLKHVSGFDDVKEDIYVNNDDNEDAAPLEELKEIYGEDFDEDKYRLSTPKGTPFLFTTTTLNNFQKTF